MTHSRTGWITTAVLAVIIASAAPAAAQESNKDGLAKAKDFYASASYEDALQVIERLRADPAGDSTEAAAYQVFCLMALGRTDQAKRAIESLVKLDPMYHPSDTQVSPRVRTFFEDTRRPMVPALARQTYMKAKAAFERKDWPAAAGEFDRAIVLLDELADADDPSVSDLRTLAVGFRDLSKNSSAPPAAPAEPPHPAAPPAPAPAPEPAPVAPLPTLPSLTDTTAPAIPRASTSMPDRTVIYGADTTDVRPPVAVSREMPPWTPSNSFESKQLFTGVVEVVVAEDGSVSSATMRKSVLQSYDASLLKAVAAWKFKPATKNGVAVKYRLEISVQLGRQPEVLRQ